MDDLEGSQTFLQAALDWTGPLSSGNKICMVAACCALLFLSSKVKRSTVPETCSKGDGQDLAKVRSSSSRRMISTSLSSRTEIRPLVPQISSKLVPGHSWAEAIKCPWAPLR